MMKRSLAKTLVAVIAIAAIVTALPLAQAGTRTNHAVNATVTSREVETRGQVTIDAGLAKDTRLGEGASLIRTRSTGGTNLALTFKVFYPSGVQRGQGTLTFTPNPNGTVSFDGNGRYTGGSGRFAGVTGNLRIDGTASADGLVTTRVRGNARY